MTKGLEVHEDKGKQATPSGLIDCLYNTYFERATAWSLQVPSGWLRWCQWYMVHVTSTNEWNESLKISSLSSKSQNAREGKCKKGTVSPGKHRIDRGNRIFTTTLPFPTPEHHSPQAPVVPSSPRHHQNPSTQPLSTPPTIR
jgi:hypothetical protein